MRSSHLPISLCQERAPTATLLRDLNQAGFKDIILITDRGYETIRNLEMYIDKGQRVIMGAKAGQGPILRI